MSYQVPNRSSDAGPAYETAAPDEPLRCGSCGARCTAMQPCLWDTDLMVGACCEADEETGCTPREMGRSEQGTAATKQTEAA